MATYLLIIFVLMLQQQRFQGCHFSKAVGLSNGYIRHEQLSASSTSNVFLSGPSHARLGAFSTWCGNYHGPAQWIREWLQVDFIKPILVTGVALQGNRKLQKDEFLVTSFYLQVSNSSQPSTFINLNNTNGTTQIFQGLDNNRDPVFHWLQMPVRTRYIRFKAKTLQNGSHEKARVCAALEFYGCGSETDLFGCKLLFPLGMENGIILDSQLSASSSSSKQINQTMARYNRLGKLAWCAKTLSNSEWFQVDIGFKASLTAMVVQGDSYGDCVTKYEIHVSNDSERFVPVNSTNGSAMSFGDIYGNVCQGPVLSMLSGLVITRYVRIYPRGKGKRSLEHCMQLEVFGYHPDGPDELLLYHQANISERIKETETRLVPNPPLVSTRSVHCLNSSQGFQPFLQLQFGKPRLLTGIAIQGHQTKSHWIKSFNLEYSNDNGEIIKMNKTFIGNRNQLEITYNWFHNPITASLLRIIPVTWNKQPCLRIQIYGKFDGATVQATEGEDVALYCPAHICLRGNFSWHYNGSVISQKRKLELFKVAPVQQGIYYCISADGMSNMSMPGIQLIVRPIEHDPAIEHHPSNNCSKMNISCGPGYICTRRNLTFTCVCKKPYREEDGSCKPSYVKQEDSRASRSITLLICLVVFTGLLLLVLIVMAFVLFYRRNKPVTRRQRSNGFNLRYEHFRENKEENLHDEQQTETEVLTEET